MTNDGQDLQRTADGGWQAYDALAGAEDSGDLEAMLAERGWSSFLDVGSAEYT
ncbi:hypothetical protein [Amycolatopsis sp. CA-230715]|uniref:hypothetical protein n=1 Tax=Amycolatopsis sp. CA-230715 TaxID=2745196 RepID=UPI001C0212EB|nr:hypothetical protein [Amycolatopsis sp. CA-230715]QWF85620.1 hypothetical protein HUW46_09075 [Amycolatopsis sp. CA-230715]